MSTQKNNTYLFSQLGYFWSLLGSAVGFGTILGFSAQSYRQGGGAFVIPYVIALLVVGFPMLMLEGVIGQSLQLPLVSAYGRFSRTLGKTMGWLAVLACLTIGGFYTVLTAFSVAYIYFSMSNSIPVDTEYFFKHTFLHDSGSLLQIGSFASIAFICTIGVAVFCWYVLVKGIRGGIERICSFFMPLLLILIVLFTLVVCFLPGATTGFYYYLCPDFSKLLHVDLWIRTFGHVFFSLSLGLGIVTAYSRYTDTTVNIRKTMFWLAIADLLVSLIAGFIVFGCIGYLSTITNIPFCQIVQSDSIFAIGYIIFPIILKTLGSTLYPVVSAIFFFCLFIAGVTGIFSIAESIIGNIEAEFNAKRSTTVTLVMGVIVLLGIVFCLGNGQYILAALEPMVLGYNMLVGGLAQIIIFLYGNTSIAHNPIWFSGNKRIIEYYLLKYAIPIMLSIIMVWQLYSLVGQGFTYSDSIMWGWLLGALSIALIVNYYQARKINHTQL